MVEVEGRLVRLSYGDYTPLEEEKRYILFLHFDDTVGAYYIIGLYQGKYNVDGRDKKEKKFLDSYEHYKKLRKEVESKYIDQAS
ncbi:hypothetical protein [Caldalkalibacillus mannanilyticus]|uniref:hypothetical protein n=1 Tax=Caldalkalibacillus mannanilyticus TaxID=1418 RepID=UPI00046A2F84|nr:hypothetical protein [Caldalkalibacillus mannanilyticus]